MLPAPDGSSESGTCRHPRPQAGPGLFNPIKNGLDQNYKGGILLPTADDCSSASRAPFCVAAVAFWVLSKRLPPWPCPKGRNGLSTTHPTMGRGRKEEKRGVSRDNSLLDSLFQEQAALHARAGCQHLTH